MPSPTTLTFLKATPFSITYQVGGGGQQGVLSLANLATACTQGPLKALITKVSAAHAGASLNLDGTRSKLVRIRHVDGVSGSLLTPAARTIVWAADQLEVTATDTSVSLIEIRLAHSVER